MKNPINKISAILSITLIVFSLSCHKDNPSDGGKPPCGGIDPGIVPEPPYNSPIWHPSGQFIGFNHTPLKRITYPYGEQCWGEQEFAYDSTGFWLINPDGTNMRRIFPYTLQTPAWSPDGDWIAFVLGAQIFKMKFTGTTFDTLTLTQLTSAGRNFFPAWSPDGRWVAYSKSICEGPNTCGIWLMTSSGTNHRFLADYGNYPEWHPIESKIIYLTPAVTQEGQTMGDSLWTFNPNLNAKSFLTFLGGQNNDNRHPRYSPDGAKIAFVSSPSPTGTNIWIMDSNGSDLHQITDNGVDADFGIPFSWSPTGNKIVYTQYQSTDWTMNNGALWMIDINSKTETQLTFNP